jgi:hypothetical protein
MTGACCATKLRDGVRVTSHTINLGTSKIETVANSTQYCSNEQQHKHVQNDYR